MINYGMFDENNLITIKKHWEVGNLDTGEIAWLIKQSEKVEKYENQIKELKVILNKHLEQF